jgi:integrase
MGRYRLQNRYRRTPDLITEATIKAAIKAAPLSGKSVTELKDGGPRGEGRLALLVRLAKGRVSTEWYAVRYVGKSRAMAKMGCYPTMGLGEARKAFAVDYAPTIARGEKPMGPRTRRVRAANTVEDLFKAYVADLGANGRVTARQVEGALLTGSKNAADAIGRSLAASEVCPANIIPHLSEIYGRGCPSQARQVRGFISAAFSYAMASENSYTRPAGAVAWNVRVNPVLAIPADPNAVRPGQRHLTPSEFRLFWHWLESMDERWGAAPALRLQMATGQRVMEIVELSEAQYDQSQKYLTWAKTKNGKPHGIPICDQAACVMAKLVPTDRGLYFPAPRDPGETVGIWQPRKLVQRFLKAHPAIPPFTPRDLRRTWKTLAGAAGVSKEIRDKLQNHALSDVSSKHYDRYGMLPERRAAVAVWGGYMARILSGELDTDLVQLGTREAR